MKEKTTNRFPIAVIGSDWHLTPTTLDIATEALKQSYALSQKLRVPFLNLGDTMDTKAIIRAEVANRLIELYSQWDKSLTSVLIGNHCKIHEKSDSHAMEFLKPYTQVIDRPHYNARLDAYFIPYQSDLETFKELLGDIPKGSLVFIHQGIQGANMGHYVSDKTALPKEIFADYRIISGHYHQAQDIKCGKPRKRAVGLFSYVGTPYTITFAEAKDGPKGVQVLYSDGLMELHPLKLRKHVIIEQTACQVISNLATNFSLVIKPNTGDLIWLKVMGTQLELAKINKRDLGIKLGTMNFKLDKIPTRAAEFARQIDKLNPLSVSAIMDKLIDDTGETLESKAALKNLWRELME